jgi:hypothetical protein
MSENVGASNSRNRKGLHGLYSDNLPFYVGNLLPDYTTSQSTEPVFVVIAVKIKLRGFSP